MPRGYWIARLDITNPDAYAAYRAKNAVAFAKFGGRFMVRGGPCMVAKGEGREHNVVIEFPTGDAARACYASPEYQDALVHLAAMGSTDLVIIDGYDGPQPGNA